VSGRHGRPRVHHLAGRRDVRHDRRFRRDDGAGHRRGVGQRRGEPRRALVAALETVKVIVTRAQGATEVATGRRAVPFSFATVVALCALVAASAARDATGSRVRIAIGGQNQMIYLPTTLAQELAIYGDNTPHAGLSRVTDDS